MYQGVGFLPPASIGGGGGGDGFFSSIFGAIGSFAAEAGPSILSGVQSNLKDKQKQQAANPARGRQQFELSADRAATAPAAR